MNTKTGHCNKTMAILTEYSSQPGPALLLVADDDTVLSATRLAQLLSCYRGEELLFLGEQIYY